MGVFTITLDEIEQLGETIFDDTDGNVYPIWEEGYREGLNRKIIDHYRMYEIGQETIGQFRFALNRKMREIMPYYNQLYKTVQEEIDPFKTMDYTDHGSSDSTTEGTSNSTTDSASRAVSSELPQVHLSGNEDYATNANDVIGNAVTNGTSNTGVNGTVDRTVSGSQGHQATLMMQYRKSLLNIDMNVISELRELFMMVWDNGDEFHNGGYGYGYIGWIAPTI
jgi:hypothetical protein